MKYPPIAIVGIANRFPGVDNRQGFWDLLCRGQDLSCIDGDEGQGHLRNLDQFDADFFNVTPEAASLMAPQHRLLLEVAWEAFEDAGLVPKALSGSNTGVFIGIGETAYHELLGESDQYKFAVTTGNHRSLAANRLSYFFDFQGISMTIDTACSSALVAVDRACRSLWTGESDLALAGGVNLILTDRVSWRLKDAGLISGQGCCRVFDAEADGYVRSDGIGLALLKPLQQAVDDGDRLYAVIRGSAVNHNGRSNGLTAPNLQAQVNLLQRAYQTANVDPQSVCYVEAHATGTPIGDALELKAIGRVLGKGRSPENFCRVGSVKTNIGHTETASGIAGLIKTILALHQQQLPPHLHFKQINSSVKLEKLGLQIPLSLESLPQSSQPLHMGVSAYGLGGTNAHIILESPPIKPKKLAPVTLPTHIFLLSAHTEKALDILIERYQTLLQKNPAITLGDLCCAVSTTRTAFDYRLCILASSLTELAQLLDDALHQKKGDRWWQDKVTKRQRNKTLLLAAQEVSTIANLETLKKESQSITEVFNNILNHWGKLWSQGFNFNWKTFYPPHLYQHIDLPLYPFQPVSHWAAQASQEIKIIKQNNTIKSVPSLRQTVTAEVVDPRNSMEQNLLTIWQEILDLEDISITDNFFDLGGNSRLSIQLAKTIEKRLQVELPIAALFELTTIEQQAYLLENKVLESSQIFDETNPSEFSLFSEEYRAFLAIVAGRQGERTRKESLIVALNPTGLRQPFFYCANGYLEAKPLSATLGQDYPFFLLESGYHVFKRNDERQIKALAAYQLEDLLRIQPQGPYAIGGYSFGTFVAYEIAQQLRQRGEVVNLLSIFDAGTYLDQKNKLPIPKFFEEGFRNLTQIINSSDNISQEKKDYTDSINSKISLLSSQNSPYQFEYYDSSLVVFLARSNFRNHLSGRKSLIWPGLRPRLLWPKDIAPYLTAHIVPGDHFSMIKEPHVKALGDKLKEYLQ